MDSEPLCPVCGFQLDFAAWTGESSADKPCPCCGIHFGHDDVIEPFRAQVYLAWRQRWKKEGKRWWSTKPAPPDFNADEQLARLEPMPDEMPE